MNCNRLSGRAFARALLLSTTALLVVPAQADDFVNVGPAPVLGQSGQAYDTYSGAVSAIVTDPADVNTIYVGTPNGGIWVTHDGGQSWTPLTDKQASLSISSLAADPTDPTHQVLVAGTGLGSNGALHGFGNSNAIYGSSGGLRDGLLYSNDGGTSWTALGESTFAGQTVDGLAVRGKTILAGTFEKSNLVSGLALNKGGLYRSTDGGATFTQVSRGAGLPPWPVTSLVGDPDNPAKLYAAVVRPSGAHAASSFAGIYVSTDTGATWSFLAGQTYPGKFEYRLATGPNGALAVGLIDLTNGTVPAVYLTKDDGASYLSAPMPDISGEFTLNYFGQAAVNFALAVDPNNTNYVYIAGDTTPNYPYTLPAYRLDFGSYTATSLSDANTADNSAVHADLRAMAFDANGRLIVSSDGGIYARTLPESSSGVWQGLTGNLSAIETYEAVYGAHAHLVAAASQDNAAALESARGSLVYDFLAGFDGGLAVVNDTTLPGHSVYYLSANNLYGLIRVVVDSSGNIVANDPVTFNIDPSASFVAPFVLNKIDPSLIAIGGDNVYLTQDTLTGADAPNTANLTLNLTALGNSFSSVTAIAYGTKDNTNALIAGMAKGTTLISLYPLKIKTFPQGLYINTSAAGKLHRLKAYKGYLPTSLVFDTRTQNRFFSADTSNLWATLNRGKTFKRLTPALPTDFIRPTSLEFIDSNGVDALLVGGLDDAANVQSPVVVADSNANGILSNWRFFGSDLPNTQVSELTYNPLADVLTVATFGRGAWLLYDVTSHFSQAAVLQFGLADNDSMPDTSLLTGDRPLIKYGTGTLLITGAATYTGGTTIEDGVLQLGNGGAGGSILGNVSNGAVFAVDRSDSYTFPGTISGTGAFMQAGTGTTVLTAKNTYTGGTFITAGTLQFGDGGTTGSVVGNIEDDASLVVDHSDALTYGGTISGTGTFAQAGPGTTMLNRHQHLHRDHAGFGRYAGGRRVYRLFERRDGEYRRDLARQRHGGAGDRQRRAGPRRRCRQHRHIVHSRQRRARYGRETRNRCGIGRHRQAGGQRRHDAQRCGHLQFHRDTALRRQRHIRDGRTRHRQLRQRSGHDHGRPLSGRRRDRHRRRPGACDDCGRRQPARPTDRCDAGSKHPGDHLEWRAHGALRRPQGPVRLDRHIDRRRSGIGAG